MVLTEGGVAVATEVVLLGVELDVPESAVSTERRAGRPLTRSGGSGAGVICQRRRFCQALSCCCRKSLHVNYTWQGSNLQPSVP